MNRTSRMVGAAVPLLMSAMPVHAATGSNPGAAEAGPVALLGVAAAVAWHYVAGRWHRTHPGRHVVVRVMPAHALVPVLSRLHLDRAHLHLLRRRARKLYRRH